MGVARTAPSALVATIALAFAPAALACTPEAYMSRAALAKITRDRAPDPWGSTGPKGSAQSAPSDWRTIAPEPAPRDVRSASRSVPPAAYAAAGLLLSGSLLGGLSAALFLRDARRRRRDAALEAALQELVAETRAGNEAERSRVPSLL